MRNHLDRHQHIGNFHSQSGDRARGWIGGEELRILFIEAGKIRRPGQQHVDFDNIIERRAAGAQDVLAVPDGLTRLFLDRGAGHLVGLRIEADDARGVDRGAGLDGLTEQRRAGCIRRFG